jgi:hypothetical protein
MEPINFVAGACGGLTRTVNKILNDNPELGRLERIKENFAQLIKNLDVISLVYNVCSGGAAGYLLGTDPATAFEVGFTGNYVLTKLIEAAVGKDRTP